MLIYIVIYFVINSCANTPSAQYICKNTKNIQKVDDMDGFCWQSELDLTLFYKIEGYRGIFLKPEILNDLNDHDLNDRKTALNIYLFF